ncbi:ubiquinol-cytochrome c reductase iron-sulfur subunit [Pseudalkalibacillus caeni]|uniref:(2Fe-2S)-binding protein n=1 Tax=Exobacillus caeni TaxID=2574798 RepID=A0A5R9FBB0_9BACL|nr:Rieske 2Fe-2S domain-containing protein [Pseudalkalibacillus caeni]TLS37834.1 (2Fe-2S)-binding protein [Pseudalkalibacillus caeni]
MTDKKKYKRNQKDSNDDMINLVDNLNRDDDVKYNRRAFLKSAVGASVALGLATLPFSVKAMLESDEEEEAFKIVSLDKVPKGSSYNFAYPTEADTALLIHTEEGEIKAYNNKCTHLQCPVFYEKEENVLLCPCHKGYFSVENGHPTAGPPQRELPLIKTEIRNGVVYAVGRKVRHG